MSGGRDWEGAVSLDKKLRAPNPAFRPHPLINVIEPARWAGKEPPARKWLIEGLIPMGNVTMLSGDGGLGKSLLALQLMVACSTGKPWLGRDAHQCKAFGLFCEDDEGELHRRLASITEANDLDMADLERIQIVPRVGLENSLMDFEQYTGAGSASSLLIDLTNHVIESGAQLVILDSLHDLFIGNENVRSQARQFIGALRALAMEINGAVLLCSHPSAAGLSSGSGSAGSTAWNNAVRSRLYLTRPKSDDTEAESETSNQRVLTTKKANYGPLEGDIDLIWEEGVFQPKGKLTGILAAIEGDGVERLFLECLNECTKAGRHVTDGVTSPRYAPKAFMRMALGSKSSRRELAKAMERLFADGRIKIGEVQNASRHKYSAIIPIHETERLV